MDNLKNPNNAKALFIGKKSCFFEACLSSGMGSVYADSFEHPRSAIASIGDFALLGGEPSEALLRDFSAMQGEKFLILVGPDQPWNELIETVYGCRAHAITRYALKKDEQSFTISSLQKIVDSLKEDYVLRAIEESLYHQCLSESWSKDLVALFTTYDQYAAHGLGFCALKEGKIVSGASSYYSYESGIEIEVDTHPEYRKQGLAAACCAQLILCCVQRGIFPSWDAHTTTSLHLAQKLGYHFDYAYTAYEIHS